MTSYRRGGRPAWRAAEPRCAWLAPLLIALTVVGVLLSEVWQSSRVAQLSLRLDRTRASYEEARARLDFLRAELERRATRPELASAALRLGLEPAGPDRVVLLPAGYLAREESPARAASPLVERFMRALVPDARAQARGGR